MTLQKKVVLITGASCGIGEATAKAFAREGASVVLVARSKERLTRVGAQIANSDTLIFPIDITCHEQVQSMIAQVLSVFGKIDVLVNNAGVGMSAPVESMSIDNFRKLIEINVFAPLMLIQAALPAMRNAQSGKILNISSMITNIVTSGSGGYRASKLALNALSDAFRYELKNSNIRVVTIFPGATATDFYHHCIGATSSENVTTKKSSGRSPEFVAEKIIEAAKKNNREVFMGLRGLIGSKIAPIFPEIIETINSMYKKTK
jgi:short-subunit dehydrogenase